MINWHPPEILVAIRPLTIRTYGLLLAISIFMSFWLADQRAKKWGVDPKLVSDVLFWGVVAGIIGARLGYILQELSYYRLHPAEILAVWTGGLSFHGSLLGGIIGVVIALAVYKKTSLFWQIADITAAPLLLAPVIGRFGNWANQELYGYPTSRPWGIAVDSIHRLPGYETFFSFHPTFAYEALLNLLGFFILVFIIEKIPRHSTGRSFLFAIAWYGLARFITEIWRISDRVSGQLSLAQIISLGMILAAIGIYKTKVGGERDKI